MKYFLKYGEEKTECDIVDVASVKEGQKFILDGSSKEVSNIERTFVKAAGKYLLQEITIVLKDIREC